MTYFNNIFRNVAEFFGKVIFHSDVAFVGRPTFNKDTAGFAVIKGDGSEVEVKFEKEYVTEPVVNISLQIAGAVEMNNLSTYAVADVNTKGFKIRMNRIAGMDLRFSWIAMAVNGATSTISTGNTVLVAPTVTPTPTTMPPADPTPIVEIITPTASESGVQPPTLTPTPTLEIEATLTSTVSATIIP